MNFTVITFLMYVIIFWNSYLEQINEIKSAKEKYSVKYIRYIAKKMKPKISKRGNNNNIKIKFPMPRLARLPLRAESQPLSVHYSDEPLTS